MRLDAVRFALNPAVTVQTTHLKDWSFIMVVGGEIVFSTAAKFSGPLMLCPKKAFLVGCNVQYSETDLVLSNYECMQTKTNTARMCSSHNALCSRQRNF